MNNNNKTKIFFGAILFAIIITFIIFHYLSYNRISNLIAAGLILLALIISIALFFYCVIKLYISLFEDSIFWGICAIICPVPFSLVALIFMFSLDSAFLMIIDRTAYINQFCIIYSILTLVYFLVLMFLRNRMVIFDSIKLLRLNFTKYIIIPYFNVILTSNLINLIFFRESNTFDNINKIVYAILLFIVTILIILFIWFFVLGLKLKKKFY